MEIGIKSPEELTKLGSKEAFIRIKMLDSTACCNTLYALEGAIKGVRWHGLDDAEKKVLKDFFQSMK
jgi:DNA transformation protein